MKKNNFGFTLIELLVVISIISILVIASSRINFNPQIDKQNSLLFFNQIYTSIETVRNNSLFGRGVLNGGNLVFPNKWVINITSSGSSSPGEVKIKYSTGGDLVDFNEYEINFIPQAKIKELKCLNIMESNSGTGSQIDIEITGNILSLSGCTSSTGSILEITTKYKQFEKIIKLNTVSGLLEKKDL